MYLYVSETIARTEGRACRDPLRVASVDGVAHVPDGMARNAPFQGRSSRRIVRYCHSWIEAPAPALGGLVPTPPNRRCGGNYHCCAYPFSFTLWISSYSNIRDVVIYALAMYSTYAAYRILVRKQNIYLMMIMASLIVLFYLRWYAAVFNSTAVSLALPDVTVHAWQRRRSWRGMSFLDSLILPSSGWDRCSSSDASARRAVVQRARPRGWIVAPCPVSRAQRRTARPRTCRGRDVGMRCSAGEL